MKRVLCIVGGMNAGGAETFLMKIYRSLDRSRYQMDFAVGIKGKGYYDDEISSLGGRIIHIVPKSEGVYNNFCSIKKLVKEEKYDYVLRTSQHSLSALELFAARLGGAKIAAFRSSNTNTTTPGGRDLILHKICSFMPKLFANVRIAPSTEAAEYMFGKNSVKLGKAHLLHNGVDLSVFKYNANHRNEIRKELDIENRLVIGHVGRFTEQKNHSFLIEIFYEIKKIREDAVLVLVGEGELLEVVREKVNSLGLENSVIFTGIRKDIPELMSSFDLFVFPSFYEGMPNTIIEAQATGLPCLISDSITKEADITGLVRYESLNKSACDWANCVCKMEWNKKRRNTTEDFIQNKYDIDSVVAEFLRLLCMQ